MFQFDFDRIKRMGFGEAVLAEGKALQDLVMIVKELTHQTPLLFTRVSDCVMKQLEKEVPEILEGYEYNPIARTLRSKRGFKQMPVASFHVAVVGAGTSDRAVIEEACETLSHYEMSFSVFADVGVAGLHRLLNIKDEIQKSDCIICVAGMDGALASVVSGLFKVPIIAVPTSVGYGMCKAGETALASMLSSCANGMSVMNIDNGYGAAIATLRIRNMLISKLGDQ